MLIIKANRDFHYNEPQFRMTHIFCRNSKNFRENKQCEVNLIFEQQLSRKFCKEISFDYRTLVRNTKVLSDVIIRRLTNDSRQFAIVTCITRQSTAVIE